MRSCGLLFGIAVQFGLTAMAFATTVGFLDTNGSFNFISIPGSTWTEAYGLNNAGQVVKRRRDL